MTSGKGWQVKVEHDKDVYVERAVCGAWLVTRRGERAPFATCRLRLHALAFARAMAFSLRVEMIVRDVGGGLTRHRRASLTYPTFLD